MASTWRTAALTVTGVLGALVLVALVVTLSEANRQRDRALALQAHSYDVMILARTLSATIARSEASLGRYVISGDKQLGRLYVDDWRLASAQLGWLRRATWDNPEQRARVRRLEAAFRARGEELSQTALNTNYGKNNQALALFYQARRADSLENIRGLLTGLISGERVLLAERSAEAMDSVSSSTTIAKVLSVFGLLLVLGAIALGTIMVRALTERGIAVAEAEAERERADELAAAVTEATNELRVQESRLRQVQKMQAVGQLTGGIAHDFNNMLAVVIGGLELAQRALTARDPELRRHLDSAYEGASRAAALTRQLLAFSREEAANPEAIGAGDLIDGMRDLLDRTLGDGITITVEDRSAGWHVHADRLQFENMMLNLAVNARDAMGGRGTLRIVADKATLAEGEHDVPDTGDYLTIAVSDTGCGMTPDVAERVFEPFFTTKPVGQGTGLGLSQMFAFVRQLDGAIRIDTAPGQGTTVTCFLPRTIVAQAAAPNQSLAPPSAIEPSSVQPLIILVVEDDPRVLSASVDALAEIGHHPIPCPDPLQAATMLERHPDVDLILSDVLMPGSTGPEMIAALGPDHAHRAVLFVTGYAGESGDFGGRSVLRKPFTLTALERAIDHAMAATRPAAPTLAAAE